MPVFNSVVTAEVKNNSVSRVYGSWFNESDENGQASQLKNVTGVLIDFISNYKDEISTPAEISVLENGYTIFEIFAKETGYFHNSTKMFNFSVAEC